MTITNGYCDLAELRAKLAFSTANTASDTQLEQIIEASSRWIERYTGRRFYGAEHSESLADQDRAVELFRTLAAEVAPGIRPAFEEYLDYALRHRAIVERFGRFPHRNAILARQSTAAEIAFLEEPGSSF